MLFIGYIRDKFVVVGLYYSVYLSFDYTNSAIAAVIEQCR